MGIKPYKITIIKNTVCFPSDGVGFRFLRSGVYAKYFFENNYETSWIVSSFDHFQKQHRTKAQCCEKKISFDDALIMINTPGYKKNTSILRLFDHFVFAVKLFIKLWKEENPKLIQCAYPTPEESFVSVLFGKIYKIPVVIDIRDKWPDVFLDIKNNSLMARITMLPYRLMQKYVMKNAYALMAANDDFLQWGLRAGKRTATKRDLVSYIPFEIPLISEKENLEADNLLQAVDYRKGDILITFAGTIGHMFDFSTVKSIVKRAQVEGVSIKIIICGDGDTKEELEEEFSTFPNVYLPGHVSSNVVFSLLLKSTLLLAPYKQMDNFKNHITNKIVEYAAAGKPILSSMQGFSKDLIEDREFGSTYLTGDDLWAVVKKYVANPDLIKKHGQSSLSTYHEIFSPDILLRDLEEHFSNLVTNFNHPL